MLTRTYQNDLDSGPFDAGTLGQLFLRAATRHAERPALWVDGTVVRYRELLESAARIAHAIHEFVPAGSATRCAVLGSRGLTDFTGILGALLAGHAYVPLNLRHPPQRLRMAMQAADVSTLIVSRDGLDTSRWLLEVSAQPISVILPDMADVPGWAASLPRHRFIASHDLHRSDIEAFPHGRDGDGAYLLFTSGSTGAPKGIMVNNANVMAYLRGAASRYLLSPDDRCTQFFELSFDLSVHDMFLSWGSGAMLFRIPDKVRMAPRQFVERHALTTWFSVPSTAATMLGLRDLRPNTMPSLRLSLFCGEQLPTSLAVALAAAAPNAVVENLYGPTEATIAITAFPMPRDPLEVAALPEVMPIGLPLPGQQAIVIGADGKPAADGEPGELCLAGSQITAGYWRRPDLTSERFVRFEWDIGDRTWYRTGDRARLTREHQLNYLGRLDRQVKIGGHRVELEEIEAALRGASNASAAAVAWPIGSDGLARGIVGFVGTTAQTAQAILKCCRENLPAYAVPSDIRFVDPWPINSNGKTDHARLRQTLQEGAQ